MAKPSTEHYHPDVFSPPGPCFACGQAVTWPSSGMKEAADERALPEHSLPRALSCPPGSPLPPPSWGSDALLQAGSCGPCGWVTPKAPALVNEDWLLTHTNTG